MEGREEAYGALIRVLYNCGNEPSEMRVLSTTNEPRRPAVRIPESDYGLGRRFHASRKWLDFLDRWPTESMDLLRGLRTVRQGRMAWGQERWDDRDIPGVYRLFLSKAWRCVRPDFSCPDWDEADRLEGSWALPGDPWAAGEAASVPPALVVGEARWSNGRHGRRILRYRWKEEPSGSWGPWGPEVVHEDDPGGLEGWAGALCRDRRDLAVLVLAGGSRVAWVSRLEGGGYATGPGIDCARRVARDREILRRAFEAPVKIPLFWKVMQRCRALLGV